MPRNDHPDYSLITSAFAAWYKRAAMILFVLFVLAVAIFLATGWHRRLSLEAVIEYREALEVLVAGHRFEALVIYMAVYAVAAGLSMPGVVFLNIGGGMIFGGLLAGFAATVAATAGATGIFLLAKTALRDIVKRWTGAHAERFAAGFREDAFNYLLFMRLVPIFPFAMGNLLPALCGVGVGTFFVATILGVIPMTMAFTFFGASLDEALASHIADYRACVADAGVNCQVRFNIWEVLTPQLIIVFAAMGVAALTPVAIKRFRMPSTRIR